MDSGASEMNQQDTPFPLHWGQTGFKETFNSNASVASKRRVVLNNTSFPIELVSCSTGSFASEATTKSNYSLCPVIARREHLVENSSSKAQSTFDQETSIEWRCQSAQGCWHNEEMATETFEPAAQNMSISLNHKKGRGFARRYSLADCSPSELHMISSDIQNASNSSGSVCFNAFQTSKPGLKAARKQAPRQALLKIVSTPVKRTRERSTVNISKDRKSSSNTLSLQENSARCEKDFTDSCKDTELEVSTEQVHNQGVGLNNASELQTAHHQKSSSEVVVSWKNQKRPESSMKRAFSALLKCICSEANIEEEKGAFHSNS